MAPARSTAAGILEAESKEGPSDAEEYDDEQPAAQGQDGAAACSSGAPRPFQGSRGGQEFVVLLVQRALRSAASHAAEWIEPTPAMGRLNSGAGHFSARRRHRIQVHGGRRIPCTARQ
ncbi:unnamed protein product [Prorocentrum cordatum]|uniref:Uncharacterized protein n=1 Tax=Prorocentrum cordatum TaxID=2364126 RepID=A0ABN9UYP4_9DINO|nr:unnamed protein product [Polarella glacialis]